MLKNNKKRGFGYRPKSQATSSFDMKSGTGK